MSAANYFHATRLSNERVAELMPLRSIPERRTEFDLASGNAPPEVLDLAMLLTAPLFLDEQPNVAIFKRYDNEDGYLSGAYWPHPDPVRLKGRIAIASLDSLANFHHFLNDEVFTTECGVGRLIVMDPSILHWVSPPLRGRLRHILFFGYDPAQEEPLDFQKQPSYS